MEVGVMEVGVRGHRALSAEWNAARGDLEFLTI